MHTSYIALLCNNYAYIANSPYSINFIGWILVTASKVEIYPTSDSLYPCRTSQSCTRILHCDASGRTKWLYPNLTVITSTPKFRGNDYLQYCIW